ncbi:DUF6531 domain-containing protein [Pseudomonas syringae pv. tomato]|uniref:DUF6531 domain-containing protein n=1 Tax=Pseudomonas syringae group genomosp. 3 TaxID=251701 RepID=UPI0022A7718D|nr:DUF6531 domain-containing protein [Pseudomonas syringae group genomosp. 3]MCZ0948651.1 DUF6531 domain-containing protein [Pseudomonas syringae pv. tomato]
MSSMVWTKMRYKIVGFLLIVGLSIAGPVEALEFNVWRQAGGVPDFSDPRQGCDFLMGFFSPSLATYYAPQFNKFEGGSFQCGIQYPDGAVRWVGNFLPIVLDCLNGSSLGGFNASCAFNVQKGSPQEEGLCSNKSSSVGNPINAANGNKYQVEIDLSLGYLNPIVISRTYNSMDGVWRHNFSSSLYFGVDAVVVVHADGREAIFQLERRGYRSNTDLGVLTKMTNGWSYQSPAGQMLSFSTQGQLLRIDNSNGSFYRLSYRDLGADRAIEIDNGFGQSVQLTEAPMHQLRKVISKAITIEYEYSSMQLSKRTTTMGSLISTREYLYEDGRSARLLTGITDERGVRFTTWAYDGQYRAVSSQHTGGVGLTMITYNSDDSTTVINELGKKNIFRYQQISGVKRIVAIEGKPTPDCPASNSTYTYNDRGLVLTKTDAKGLVTIYDYNDRGLEVSRTEASGTSLARTTTTEWDPDRFLPIKVIEPNRITVYSYDNQGRELTRQSTSR